jgi:hypothetical protein
MPIIPPSISPWKPLRVAVDAVTAAASALADAPVAALTAIASAVPPPRSSPDPLNYCGIVTDTTTGTIISITEPSTMSDLQTIRSKIIEGSNGARSLVIVEKLVGAALAPNMPTSSILDLIEANQRDGYRLLLDSHRVRL